MEALEELEKRIAELAKSKIVLRVKKIRTDEERHGSLFTVHLLTDDHGSCLQVKFSGTNRFQEGIISQFSRSRSWDKDEITQHWLAVDKKLLGDGRVLISRVRTRLSKKTNRVVIISHECDGRLDGGTYTFLARCFELLLRHETGAPDFLGLRLRFGVFLRENDPERVLRNLVD